MQRDTLYRLTLLDVADGPDGVIGPEHNSVLKIEPRALTTGRQPPLVNHRSSVNRVDRERFASDRIIHQPVSR